MTLIVTVIVIVIVTVNVTVIVTVIVNVIVIVIVNVIVTVTVIVIVKVGVTMIIGKIHSLESFGTVDGPGIRFVTFMQGCPLRCQYCHNPDTWDVNAEVKYKWTPQQLLDEVLRYKSFIKSGGVTLTGGEPLLQADFCREFFRLCREVGIHTAIDTSGAVMNERTLAVLDYTDLVLLDIKALHQEHCKKVCGADGKNALRLLDELERRGIETWVRHVVVPGLTDDDQQLDELYEYVSRYQVVTKIEWLPYHTMGAFKYKELGLDYPLDGVEPLSAERIRDIKRKRIISK